MKTRDDMFTAGLALANSFCGRNGVFMPEVERLNPKQRNYHIGTCAYYRPHKICIMVEKCAHLGHGGPAWSWPGYAIDRTPYGVVQHELGHHFDTVKTGEVTKGNLMEKLFSKRIWELSKEDPLTNYLGTDKHEATFFMEWFAENFRLFVTNSDLSLKLRPLFHGAMIANGVHPVSTDDWDMTLYLNGATRRIVEQAQIKIAQLQK